MDAQPTPAAAPSTAPLGITLALGVTHFNLAGSGTTPVGALRVERSLLPWFILQGALTMAWPEQEEIGITALIVPEVQAQWSPLGGAFRPYLGAGIGFAVDVPNGAPTRTELAVSGAGGVRYAIGPKGTLVVELRMRRLGSDFERRTAEWTVGWMLPL